MIVNNGNATAIKLIARLLSAALLILLSAPVAAYIGPGSGLSLLGGLWSLIVGLVLALSAILFWPVKLLLRRLGLIKPRATEPAASPGSAPERAPEPTSDAPVGSGGWLIPVIVAAMLALLALLGAPPEPEPEAARRLVVLGFDGMDPVLAERWMSEGKLPNFQRLAESGHFQPLGTSNPPQSPVAWSDFATGEHAGHHGIFDFLRRDPEHYAPRFSISEDRPPEHQLHLFGETIPLGAGTTINRRLGEPFWTALETEGVRASVMRVPVTWPPDEIHRMLSGMGVPDLIGSQGTYTLFSTQRLGPAGDASRVVRVRPGLDGRIQTELAGPADPLDPDQTLAVPLEILPDPDGARIRLSDFNEVLKAGQWSRWIRLRFEGTGPLAVHGNVRLLLVQGYPRPRLYVSPIQIDPLAPAAPLSWPPEYAAELAQRIGLYHTLGMPEETWSLNEEHISDADWLAMEHTILAEREAMWFDTLDRRDSELVVGVFVQTDRVSHMFWRGLDPLHPRHEDVAPEHRDAIEQIYREADRILGETLQRLAPGDELIVLSDHGFAPFRRAVHLNRWLAEHGYLVLEDGAAESGALFAAVDWSRTRAYALGLNGVFINQAGRESRGIVPEADVPALKRELTEALQSWTDPETGRHVVSEVFDGARLYPGPAHVEERPDLVVGYDEGYRASWQTTLGAVPAALIEDNRQKWSGDHCIDPTRVPGVLFTSFTPDRAIGNIRNLRTLIEARVPRDPPKPAQMDTPEREYGWLEWPAPLFDRIDRTLSRFLPVWARLVFWALLSGWLTMWIYRVVSNQARLNQVRLESRAMRRRIRDYDGAFGELLPLVTANLGLALKHLQLALGPALLAGLPVLFVLVWVSVAYGVRMPIPGQPVAVSVHTSEDVDATGWQWAGTAAEAGEHDDSVTRWRIDWPRPDRPARLIDTDGRTRALLPPAQPTPVLHPKRWWNRLIANPGGYLDPESGIDRLDIDMPIVEVWPVGPAWLRGWPAPYFLVLIIAAVYLKVRWKVH
ncbi:MAG: hypothetical protein Kow0020_02770 [Wenzhouxiangellaceae bacterium]